MTDRITSLRMALTTTQTHTSTSASSWVMRDSRVCIVSRSGGMSALRACTCSLSFCSASFSSRYNTDVLTTSGDTTWHTHNHARRS
jgi:hypothetical protein